MAEEVGASSSSCSAARRGGHKPASNVFARKRDPRGTQHPLRWQRTRQVPPGGGGGDGARCGTARWKEKVDEAKEVRAPPSSAAAAGEGHVTRVRGLRTKAGTRETQNSSRIEHSLRWQRTQDIPPDDHDSGGGGGGDGRVGKGGGGVARFVVSGGQGVVKLASATFARIPENRNQAFAMMAANARNAPRRS